MKLFVHTYLHSIRLVDFMCTLKGCFCILFSKLQLKDNRSFYPSQ